MFPFWDLAIWPVIEAAGAQRVVEIGALRGETTMLMLDRLGPQSELHVIDPVPEFDPTDHERRFPGRYVFHRDTSHNVLPNLPPVDVALVDGDHNWYTVYHELRMLAATSREAGRPLPVLILHDVLWPYGRRDLYYEPDRIPAEFRQPYQQRGMRPERPKLLGGGGLNKQLHNAITEGGPRNGVMTALEDFLAEWDRPVRQVVLPIYFGLAIVVEQETLRQRPELARVLDALEDATGQHQLLELSESIRLEAAIFEQNIAANKEAKLERAADRYLDLLGDALLDLHYLDHEMRLAHLASCVVRGTAPDRKRLADPSRFVHRSIRPPADARRAGAQVSGDAGSSLLPYTDIGQVRLRALRDTLESLRTERVAGDLVECGTRRGGAGVYMRGFLEAYEITDRTVWVADTFTPLAEVEQQGLLAVSTDLNNVRDAYARFGLLHDDVRFVQGAYDDLFEQAGPEQIALLRIGRGLGAGAATVLSRCYDRMAVGGAVIVDDYAEPDCRAAVDAFLAGRGEDTTLERIDASAVRWRTTEPGSVPVPAAARVATTTNESIDLSIVVVVYNMRREAERTLHSLSRAYQRGIEDLTYEVVVVENGSDDSQRLGEEFVHAFGSEFRYIDLGDAATPSPVGALNRGWQAAGGRNIAFMIDGAHLLSPGVLRHAMAGLETYSPTIVAVQQWYVGPGQQGDAMQSGYDQAAEDRLFRSIEWPVDGYRVFEISHFIGERDWFDGMWESNCIFVPRKLLEQSGAFDESFSMPGGGYANLDLYERLASAPGVGITTILGEGSFHQVHGGTTTNEAAADTRRRRIVSYGEHYAQLRGRPFQGPAKNLYYVGGMTVAARRTRARRMNASAFAKGRITSGVDGRPEAPVPIPEELRTAFVDAYWYGLAWERTRWLGESLPSSPADLVAYQDVVAQTRPDWVVVIGPRSGNRAFFFATICDLLGHGRVVAVDAEPSIAAVDHPRIEVVEGDPTSADTVGRVDEIVAGGTALVVLATSATAVRTRELFVAYEHLVPAGSYVIVENTVVNGHPVWPGFGPGPLEGTHGILAMNPDFVADPDLERYAPTFNPGGFLKRIG
jgi:cephalosporin hydroxylase